MTKRLFSKDIPLAASLLRAGEVVAFPTETVYGMGAAFSKPEAALAIYELKNRPLDKPLTAHVSSLEMARELDVELCEAFFRLAEAFLPGPLTVVLATREGSLGIRIPSHPIAQALIEEVGEPLLATSANLSGSMSPISPEEVLAAFDGKIPALLFDGNCPVGKPSTVVSLVDGPVILRSGAIDKQSILKVLS